ncbi:MAG: ABC transporter substrate-binding protein [Actinobacteria bacterium]|nr:ABC transporter substrate-binding protein [Actinomycetota bacterium]
MKRSKWIIFLLVLALMATACSTTSESEVTTTTADGSGASSTTQATTTTAAVSETSSTTEATPTPALEGVDLTLWGWSSSDAENSALSDLVAQFSADTGANAEFQAQAEFDVALQAALASGAPPDVFYVDSFKLPDLADAGVLAPVPDGALSDPDDIYPSLRNAFTFNGTWYCPPKDFSTLALVYDPDALAAAGVDVPTTWDELEAAAATLTTGDVAAIAAGDAQAGLTMGVEYPRWAVFLFQAGAALTDDAVTKITLDNDAARTALQFVADQYAAGSFIKPQAVDAGWAGEAFGQGKAAMTIEGNWIVGYLQDAFPDKNFAVAELPAGPAGMGTFAFTVCYGVAKDAKNPDASWAFVEYLTNAKGSLAWTNAFNVMPARKSVSADWIASHPDLNAFVAGSAYAHRWGFVPGFNDVVGVFNENAEGIVDGTASVDDLITKVTQAGEDVLH